MLRIDPLTGGLSPVAGSPFSIDLTGNQFSFHPEEPCSTPLLALRSRDQNYTVDRENRVPTFSSMLNLSSDIVNPVRLQTEPTSTLRDRFGNSLLFGLAIDGVSLSQVTGSPFIGGTGCQT